MNLRIALVMAIILCQTARPVNAGAAAQSNHAAPTSAKIELRKSTKGLSPSAIEAITPAENLVRLGNGCTGRGKYLEAKDLFLKALRDPEASRNSFLKNRILNKLDVLAAYQREHLQMSVYREEAAKLKQKIADASGKDLALNQLDLGELNSRIKECKQAEDYFQEAITLLGNNDLANLAMLYYQSGRYLDAESVYGRLLEEEEKTGRRNCVNAIDWVAKVRRKTGRYDDIETLYVKAIAYEIAHRRWPHQTLGEAFLLDKIAQLYRLQNRLHEAELKLRESIDVQQRENTFFYSKDELKPVLEMQPAASDHVLSNGEHNPSLGLLDMEGRSFPPITDTLNELAVVLQEQGKYDQAQALYKLTIKMREKSGAINYVETGDCLNALACLEQNKKNYVEAEALFITLLFLI